MWWGSKTKIITPPPHCHAQQGWETFWPVSHFLWPSTAQSLSEAISSPSGVAREGEAGPPAWTHRRTAVLPVPGELLGCWPEDHQEASDFPSFHQPSLSLVGAMGLGIRTLRHTDKVWLRLGSTLPTTAAGGILGPSPGSYSGHTGHSNGWVKESKRSVYVCAHACKSGW